MGAGYDFQAVEQAWALLQSDQLYDSASVRDVVTLSWMRCKMKEIDPHNTAFRIASKRGISATVNARPTLYSFIFSLLRRQEAEGFFDEALAILTDARGNVLKLAGNAALLEQAEAMGITEGFSLNEDVVGTNAVGTCIYNHEPAYIWANEHYIDAFKQMFCSAAPIYDHNGEMVGALGLMTAGREQHPFPLALARSMAESICQEVKLYHRLVAVLDGESRLDMLINTMNYGVIFLDAQHRVSKINSIARYYLLTYEHEVMDTEITDIISPEEIDFHAVDGNLHERVVTITTSEGKRFQYLASVYLLPPKTPSITKFLITLNSYQAAEQPGAQRRDVFEAGYTFDDVVGTHPLVKETIRLAKRAARTDSNILITGESGTGKELVAQSIHNASKYSKGPFVALNCGAIPKDLIESELFGYEEGAFTGARKGGAAGKFEQANGGTIFLDEIGDMPPGLQVSLLRFLQNHEITRLGGKKPIKVHVRIITATNKNLEEAMARGSFRSDLYYRINIINIRVPPLRERGGDIANLAHYFLQKYKARSENVFTGFSAAALEAMQGYGWPGNVREMENAVERAVLTARGSVITLEDLPEQVRNVETTAVDDAVRLPVIVETAAPAAPVTVQDMEKSAMLHALATNGGSVAKAAAQIGMSRRTFYRKLQRYGIER